MVDVDAVEPLDVLRAGAIDFGQALPGRGRIHILDAGRLGDPGLLRAEQPDPQDPGLVTKRSRKTAESSSGGTTSGGADPSTPPASGASTARNRPGPERLITPPSASGTDTRSCAATCELIARSSSGRPSWRATSGAIMLPPAP